MHNALNLPVVEQVISAQPFVVRRRVIWGETDAAGVVYTNRYIDYTASANMLFMAHALGVGAGEGKSLTLTQAKKLHGIGTPCKALSAVFHASLRCDELFDMQVQVARIGNTTFELLVMGRTPEGAPVFEGRNTIITIAHSDENMGRKAMRVPDSVRQALEPYLQA